MNRLFKIFAIAAIALGFTECDTPNSDTETTANTITLEADKSTIAADGVDFVTFTALVNGEANEGVQIVSLKNNEILKENKFSTTTPGEYKFKAIFGKDSSAEVKVTANATVLLSADKESILADGVEVVTFIVTVDGEDKTSESVITNLVYNIALEGNTFSDNVAGEFTFRAKYKQWESNEVKVTTTALPTPKTLKLVATPNRIKADGIEEAIFTVMYGEEDVTASCTLHTTTGAAIEGNEFSTTTAGTYNFYAIYEETKRSNTLSIDAYDPDVVGQYDIGTVCEVNGTKGVVYAIKNNKVYVVSLDEAFLQWSTENIWCNCMSENGSLNTSDPFDPTYCRADGGVRDINNYPAFKWCKEHGADWYLPSSTELQWLWDVTSGGKHEYNCDEMNAFNKILTDNGGTAIQEDYYWSSNETSEDLIEFVAFMHNSVICADPQKTSKMLTRAITRFNI